MTLYLLSEGSGEGLYLVSLTERSVYTLTLEVCAAGLGSSSPFCQVPNGRLFPLSGYLHVHFSKWDFVPFRCWVSFVQDVAQQRFTCDCSWWLLMKKIWSSLSLFTTTFYGEAFFCLIPLPTPVLSPAVARRRPWRESLCGFSEKFFSCWALFLLCWLFAGSPGQGRVVKQFVLQLVFSRWGGQGEKNPTTLALKFPRQWEQGTLFLYFFSNKKFSRKGVRSILSCW